MMTCKVLSFHATNRNAYQNKSSVYIVTDNMKNSATDCCLLHHDVQGVLLKPTWMLNSTSVIQGPPVSMDGRICHSWINTKPDIISRGEDTWLVSAGGQICGYKGNFQANPSISFLGLSPYLSFDLETYSTASQDDDLFVLPVGGVDRCAKPCKGTKKIKESS